MARQAGSIEVLLLASQIAASRRRDRMMLRIEVLLCQDQFALLGPTQAINLPVVLNPNFIATSSQRFEADNFWQRFRIHLEGIMLLLVIAILRIWIVGRPSVHTSHGLNRVRLYPRCGQKSNWVGSFDNHRLLLAVL